jgi:hypothetical protein
VTAALNKIGQLAIVTVSIVAWFSIFNHCALGGAIARATMQSAAASTHCHGDQPVPSKNGGEKETPCCKLLLATLNGDAKTVQNPSTNFLPIQSLAFDVLVCADDAQFRCHLVELDTGPPGSRSFAELILQRSILTHAPPLFLS